MHCSGLLQFTFIDKYCRSSWDPMTLVAAVRGAQGIGCEEIGHGGRNEVNEWGGNYWVEDAEGGSNQTYLKLNVRQGI